MRRARYIVAFALTLSAVTLVTARAAEAQGKGHGNGHGNGAAHGGGGGKIPPGQAKKVASPGQAVGVAREVLVGQGYEVVRVEQLGGDQVVYYRRGNMGRGKGKGPLMKMIVRPTPDRIVFVSAPPRALLEINLRLGQ